MDKYLREKGVLEILPFGKTTLWSMVRGGKFPQPIKLTDRVTVWSESEIQAWVKAKRDGSSDGISQNYEAQNKAA